MRRKIQVFGWTLIWGGVFIFGYLGWQLFVTDFINNGVQAQAAGDLDTTLGDARENPTDPVELDAADYLGPETDLPSGTPEQVDHHAEEAPDTGEPFAFIRIPIAGVDEVVFEGVDPNTLKSGPGHMESTALPGQPGNAVISGHRTTHGRPFFDLDLLEIGDQIFMESTTGTHTYEVRATQVVTPARFACW